MFKCLGWPCPATFMFCFWRHQSWHFGLLALRNTCCGNACFGLQVSSKYGTWYSERVILQFMCVGSLAGVTYLRYTVLMSSNKSETAVHCCDPGLSILVMLVSRNVFHVVSALQSFAYSFTIARALMTKAQVICARSKENISVFRFLWRQYEHKKQNWR